MKLGHLYDQGKGVPQGYAKAIEWLRKAAARGDAKAEAKLGFMYMGGKGVQQDPLRQQCGFERLLSTEGFRLK